MSKLRHPFCVRYFGVCLDPPCLLMVRARAGAAAAQPAAVAPGMLCGQHGRAAGAAFAPGFTAESFAAASCSLRACWCGLLAG